MFEIPSDPEEVIDVYRRAAEENRSDALLEGSTLRFPNYGQLVMTGDELLPPGSLPEGARIVDSNSLMLWALVARDGEQTEAPE